MITAQRKIHRLVWLLLAPLLLILLLSATRPGVDPYPANPGIAPAPGSSQPGAAPTGMLP